MQNNIRTRIAPSPTGPLHIGTARSALFNFAYARKLGGTFVLRIEDTDRARSEKRYEEEIISSLQWLGLAWDEKPYRQSERKDRYEYHLKALYDRGAAYWCPHTEEELEAERERLLEAKQPPIHSCEFRDVRREPDGSGVFRFKNTTEGEILFTDMIRGAIKTRSDLIGDFSIAKSFQEPLYNFAVVIDDAEMTISHVIRGEDHISNTPKQLLLMRTLGFEPPTYAHVPLVLGTDRSKLSKRHGPTSLLDYRDQGYVSEALINFMALLGWHPEGDREIFTLDEFVRDFSLERVQKAGAVFDIEKLNFLNREHIRRYSLEALADILKSHIQNVSLQELAAFPKQWKKVVELSRERLTRLTDITEFAGPFYHFRWENAAYPLDISDLRWKGEQATNSIQTHLNFLRETLDAIGGNKWTRENLEAAIMPYANHQGRGEVLWPFRMALLGERNSPGPFEIADALGKHETLRRLDYVLANLP